MRPAHTVISDEGDIDSNLQDPTRVKYSASNWAECRLHNYWFTLHENLIRSGATLCRRISYRSFHVFLHCVSIIKKGIVQVTLIASSPSQPNYTSSSSINCMPLLGLDATIASIIRPFSFGIKNLSWEIGISGYLMQFAIMCNGYFESY